MVRTVTLGMVVGALTLSAVAVNAQHGGKDIVDTAVAAGSFKTLAKALQAADLVATLKGKGSYTVFAPTDEAFAKLPASKTCSRRRTRQAEANSHVPYRLRPRFGVRGGQAAVDLRE